MNYANIYQFIEVKKREKILAISYLDKYGNISTPYDDVGIECFVMLNN